MEQQKHAQKRKNVNIWGKYKKNSKGLEKIRNKYRTKWEERKRQKPKEEEKTSVTEQNKTEQWRNDFMELLGARER